MQLDMITMSAVDITVTTVLGLVLVFTWQRERTARLVGWWGLVMLLQAAGVVVTASATLLDNGEFLAFGLALMVLSESLKWTASREFANRPTSAAWALLGPASFLLIIYSGYVGSLLDRFLVFCALTALCNFGAAFELSRDDGKRLISHWPAVILLGVTGVACMAWVPLSLARPFHDASEAFLSNWFSGLSLVMVLARVALAFVVLAMAKQRQEMQQRVDALTDTLTGLPNRRALFDWIDALEQNKTFQAGEISVLFFDLDHFKDVNDTFGHETGDRVLKLFAATVVDYFEDRGTIARMGGEEFAAILPGMGAAEAFETAEAIRQSFARSAAEVDGRNIGTTVSVGIASRARTPCDDSDIGALFRRADVALYAAKRSGRNRVEFAGPKDGPSPGVTVRGSRRRKSPVEGRIVVNA